MSIFNGLGPFAEGLSISELGIAATRMTKAIQAVPEAYEAARALGDCQRAERRRQALAALNALPAEKQRRIHTEYLRQCRREVA